MIQRYGRVVLAGSVWAALCLGLPALAETLNGLKPGGSPLGLALVAQGATALLLVAAVALAGRSKPPAPSSGESNTP